MALAIQTNGKAVLAGDSDAGGTRDFALTRYNLDGSLDTTFGNGGKVLTDFGGFDDAFGVAVQRNHKLVTVGFTDPGGSGGADFAVARYNADGSLDPSFGAGGKVTTDFGGVDSADAVAIQTDGRIVVAGTGGHGFHFAVARYNRDGKLDASFGAGGMVTTTFATVDFGNAVDLQRDGKIVVAGRAFGPVGDVFAVARYERDGTLDATFGAGGRVTTPFGPFSGASAIEIQPDRRILVAGHAFSIARSDFDFGLVRYRSDGSLDQTFGVGGKVETDVGFNEGVNGVALQRGGEIVAGGTDGRSHDLVVARYDSNGSLDPTFGTGGVVKTDVGADDNMMDLALRGTTIVGAGLTNVAGTYDFVVARYLG
jgi:uncharacterized delta-60 repeat protein